ncbi:hypothetical protein AB0C59_10760 [Streptomyces sp. NPDC048664]
MIDGAIRFLGLVGSVAGAGLVLRFTADVVMPRYGLARLIVMVGNCHDKQ